MLSKFTVCMTALLLALSMTFACAKSSSPTTPTTTTITLPSPTLVSPAAAAAIPASARPVTLTVTNLAGASATATYTFEVATDAAFNSKVATKTATPGASGQTSVVVDILNPSTTYYWRVMVTDGANAGTFSAAKQFAIGSVIGVPTLVSPLNNATVGTKPHFTINNSTQSGAVTVTYKYQIATDTAFANVIETGSVAQQSGGQTSWDGSTTLTGGSTYYWRVSGNDASGGSGFSSSLKFSVTSFNPATAVFHNNPPIGRWAETAQITAVDFSEGYVVVDFDKRQGGGRWPDVPFGDGAGGTIQYTLGMCMFIQQEWHCSAVIQFWEGRDLYQGGSANEIGINWFYDPRWGIMNGYQPRQGELVAIFAAAGNVRDSLSWAQEQRTNFLLVPFGQSYSKTSKIK